MKERNSKNRLDPLQALVYRELFRSREWTPGAGWNYGSRAQTVRILDSLVRSGYATKEPFVQRDSHGPHEDFKYRPVL
jgi:hypothetical protein